MLDEADFEMIKKSVLLLDRRIMMLDETMKKLEQTLKKVTTAIENLDPETKQRRLDALLRSVPRKSESSSGSSSSD